MEVLYRSGHCRCINRRLYDEGIVEIFEEAEDKTVVKDTGCTTILYVLQSSADISYGEVGSYMLTEGDLMMFPPGMRIMARIKGPSRAMVMRLNDSARILCDEYTLEKLYDRYDKATLTHKHLKGNTMVRLHMNYLAENMVSGLSCARFLDMKVQELFFYLSAYYDEKELAEFHLPLLGSDALFMDFIWKNYRKVDNVKQFAELANLSMSAFKTKFKIITGESASKWLLERRAVNIYHDINCSRKSLKEISKDYHFSSVSYFGRFCLKMFGKSPLDLRHGRELGENMSKSDKNTSHCDIIA